MSKDPAMTEPTSTARSGISVADFAVGVLLFVATAGFVLWQNLHLTVLWDLSYILENATRMAQGQLPYRDFPFPYAPLTFLVQAALIKLLGRAVIHHYVYAALASGLATLLTWRILIRLLGRTGLPVRGTAFVLSLPLVFLGTSSIFPHPFYDADCTLFILFCTWLLLRVEAHAFPARATFACGMMLVVPVFIKQNTGLIFLLSAALCILLFGVRSRRASLLLLSGAAVSAALAVAIVGGTVGLGNYYQWTVRFAASRRLPGFRALLDVYLNRELLWLYAAFVLGFGLWLLARRRHHAALGWCGAALLSAPFVATVVALFTQDNASDRVEALLHLWPVLLLVSLVFALRGVPGMTKLADLVPLILLGTIHGAFLSQQLWGSTYALWPLFLILLAAVLAALHLGQGASAGVRVPGIAFCAVVSLALLVSGGYYALSHERLQYVDLSGDVLQHSKLPALRGMAMRGDWLADFEELVAYTNREIPREQAILMLPGEDLFYFTTGRTPRFPVVMMDNTVNPYSAAQLSELARQRNVRWLVVKRNLQLQEEPVTFRGQLLAMLAQDFVQVESLNNYDIFRRKD